MLITVGPEFEEGVKRAALFADRPENVWIEGIDGAYVALTCLTPEQLMAYQSVFTSAGCIRKGIILPCPKDGDAGYVVECTDAVPLSDVLVYLFNVQGDQTRNILRAVMWKSVYFTPDGAGGWKAGHVFGDMPL